MKKKVFSVITIFMVALFLGACVKTTAKPDNYYRLPSYITKYKDSDLSGLEEYAVLPTREQVDVFNHVLEVVSQFRTFDKEKLTLKVLPNDVFGGDGCLQRTALYGGNGVIYIPESFDESGKSFLCHEIYHYMSDGDHVGIQTVVSNGRKEYPACHALNEGITNYFSTKVIRHPDGVSVYEYETHVAAELAVIFGEKKLWNVYSQGKTEALRNDFNAALSAIYPNEILDEIELTPFDVFSETLDVYMMYMDGFDRISKEYGKEATIDEFSKLVNSIEEMLYFYAVQKGKLHVAQEEMKNFLTNGSGIINFSGLTKIPVYADK